MGDSQQYEVLSFEEIDDLKKELSLLETRIDATKRKLILESKLRDAAQSLNRLYAPNGSRESTVNGIKDSAKRHRRSIMGSRGNSVDLLNKTDDEMASSAKKCEALAQELWKLEKRAQDLQKRLLEHTAGVLQMTHKGFLKDMPPQIPENIPDYVNGRDSSREINLAHDFDDLSFYRTLDGVLDVGETQANGRSEAFTQQTEAILETERRLENLNQRLRDSIAQSTTFRQPIPAPPVRTHEDEEGPEIALQEQLKYLEKGLEIIQQDRHVVSQNVKQSTYATEERLEDLNSQLHGIITRSGKEPNAGYPLPPQVSGQSTKEQIGYLENGLDTIEQSIQQIMDDGQILSTRAVSHEEKAEQFETTLLGLWDILIAEEEDSRRQALQNNQTKQAVPHEKFSLQSFSAKVQSLHVRVTELQEQKEILKRQVQQQRDLNSKSDAQKDAQLTEQTVALEQTNKSLEEKDREARETRDELVLLAERFDVVRQEAALQEHNARKEVEERVYAELQAKQEEIEKFEAKIAAIREDHIGRLEESNRRIQSLSVELASVKEAKAYQEADEATRRQAIEAKTQEAEKVQNEMKNVEGEMVRLQTELTIARAELDGAYGTRAQRAAEGVPNPAIQKELEELNERNTSHLRELTALKTQNETISSKHTELGHRVETLQRELSETISEYELMTKASIEYEKEREQLENYVDSLRDRCEALEGQLSEEKLRWLGVQSPGSNAREAMASGNTSTSVLKNEFKKMMRETRAEHLRALRVSYALSCWGTEKLMAKTGRTRRTPKAGRTSSQRETRSVHREIFSEPEHDRTSIVEARRECDMALRKCVVRPSITKVLTRQGHVDMTCPRRVKLAVKVRKSCGTVLINGACHVPLDRSQKKMSYVEVEVLVTTEAWSCMSTLFEHMRYKIIRAGRERSKDCKRNGKYASYASHEK